MPSGVYIRSESNRKALIKSLSKNWSTPWNKGRKGLQKNHNISGLNKKGSIPWNKGKKVLATSGKNNYQWKEDRTQIVDYWTERNNSEYRYWRKQIWYRDGYKCKILNADCGGRIEVHHILGWKSHPELRYKINNGISLCHFHHPRKREDEIKLSPYFQNLVASSK